MWAANLVQYAVAESKRPCPIIKYACHIHAKSLKRQLNITELAIIQFSRPLRREHLKESFDAAADNAKATPCTVQKVLLNTPFEAFREVRMAHKKVTDVAQRARQRLGHLVD